jgi:hypothetical protein
MKKPQVMRKTPQRPLSYFRNKTKEELDQEVKLNVAKLHKINNRRQAFLKRVPEGQDEDYKKTMEGYFDIEYNSDLF